ncbi:hypothetical protein BBD42_05605 [Paenibacillus sp. BIHB 4019]|uniref:Uncharacterized protein n=1 Tax=Paenibacillus sp. BIHB 4019 TaxID=1870819 RepID=A0A1B2DSA7_9BACL|nr:hypothetical protein BBD42_05605 [Paenibacillus sp. BIHB 4019]
MKLLKGGNHVQIVPALQGKRWPKDTIAAGYRHTVGLKADGTVTAVGRNNEGQCKVSGWCGIQVPDN